MRGRCAIPGAGLSPVKSAGMSKHSGKTKQLISKNKNK